MVPMSTLASSVRLLQSPRSVPTPSVAGHEHMGIVREQATNVMFGKPFTMTVIIDNDFTVYNELRSWFDTIAQNTNQDQRGFRTQRMNYSSTYVEDMQLIKYEQPETQPVYW